MGKPLLLSIIVLAGCGGALAGGGGGTAPPGGSDSAEAAIRGYFAALGAGNEVTAISYLPSEGVLDAAFQCGPNGSMIKQLNEWRDDTRKSAKESRDAGLSVQVLGVSPDGAPKLIRRGESASGCIARQDITHGEYEVRFRVSAGGRSQDDNKGMAAAKLGGGWFVIND